MDIEFVSNDMTRIAMPYNHLRVWHMLATWHEKREFVRLVGVSKSYIHAMCYGKRRPSMEVALRIEAATKELAVAAAGRLPLLTVSQLMQGKEQTQAERV